MGWGEAFFATRAFYASLEQFLTFGLVKKLNTFSSPLFVQSLRLLLLQRDLRAERRPH